MPHDQMQNWRHLSSDNQPRKLVGVYVYVGLLLIGCSTSKPQSTVKQENEVLNASPSFEVATVKAFHAGPQSLGGFYSYPGGKILVGGATILTLIHYAYDVQEFQIVGTPKWARSARFDVIALEPESLRDGKQSVTRSRPTPLQREMLRRLMSERFGLILHEDSKEQAVLLLTKGDGEPKMGPVKDNTRDPRGGVWVTPDGIADGRAMGINMTMSFLARQLSEDLERLVVDRTGLTGAYDFLLPAEDTSNRDLNAAIVRIVERLGLKLKPGRAPVETIVIDQVTQPTEN